MKEGAKQRRYMETLALELTEGWEQAGQPHLSPFLPRFRPWPEYRDRLW